MPADLNALHHSLIDACPLCAADAADVDRLVLAVLDLDTCNLDHGADTPCVCDNHPWFAKDDDHEAGCRELREALLPFRGARLPKEEFSDRG